MSPNALESARQTLLVLLPEILILAVATTMVTAGAFLRAPRKVWSSISAATLVIALIALVALQGQATDPYTSVALNDALSITARLLFLVAGLILVAMAHDQVDDARASEFFGALLFVQAGAMLVASANEIVFLFVGLELVSIPTYLLLYLARRNEFTREAATKYFFLSIFASALLLFGLAYLYGLMGVGNLKALAMLMTLPDKPQNQLAMIATVFILAGLGFRVAAVPFHFYAPDVYQGSPPVIAAMLAWVPKGVGFLAILRVLTGVFAGTTPDGFLKNAAFLAWIIAAVTMTLGNTVALSQNNLKRLFAYSSIAHAGYLMIGVSVAFRNGTRTTGLALGSEALLYYLAAYAFMTLGVFAVIIALNTGKRAVENVDDLSGLKQTNPWLALSMAICLFSLAGIPPLAGFFGKFELFAAAFSASRDDDAAMFRILALVGAINSAIGAYYYLRIVVVMYLKRPVGPAIDAKPAWPTTLAVAACAIATVLLGLFANPAMNAARSAAESVVAQPAPDKPLAETAGR